MVHGRRGSTLATGHGEGGPASKRVIVGYGFWIFLLSDIVMFSAFFAAHAVLQTATAGGPSGRELFNLWSIAIADGISAHLELHLRAIGRSDRGTKPAVDTGRLLVTGLFGAGVPVARGAGFCRAW